MSTENLWDAIRRQLEEQGVDPERLACVPGGTPPPRSRWSALRQSLRDSVDALGAASRDQVVMVRVDGATRAALDAWVETGAVKSRSEAAALFIREGLKVRHGELRELADALESVNEARTELRDKARRVLGADEPNQMDREEEAT